MGCDIHIALEKKISDKWVMVRRVGNPNNRQGADARNYELFTAIASVRAGTEDTGLEPKGIPGDVSESTRLFIDEWDGDGHDHSHMGLWTACLYWTKFNSIGYMFEFPAGEYFGEDGDDLKYEDYRIVFFFDN